MARPAGYESTTPWFVGAAAARPFILLCTALSCTVRVPSKSLQPSTPRPLECRPTMARESHKQKLLTEGLRVVHERGYGGASVRDIVAAAGVPQGSFTNHFASKEAFGLEVLDLYYARSCKMMRETLGNEALSPLGRIRAYVEAYRSFFRQRGCQHGCLCGNFAAEASDQSEPLRKRNAEIFEDIQRRLVDCL